MEPILISIVTHNSKDIFQTLDQFATFLPDSTYQIVIYDNASEKEYIEKLKRYPFVRVIQSSENRGFGYGHNQVLLSAKGATAIICNPDILVTKQSLDELVKLVQHNPISKKTALVTPKVLNEDGTTQYLVRHKLTVFDYALRFMPIQLVKKRFDKRLADYECRGLSDTTYSQIRMGSGCFMAINLHAFQEIQGFDERFFMYFEDNDLCLRFEKAGYDIVYTPFHPVTHLYGKGAHRNGKLFFVFMRSMAQFFMKWGWKFY